MILPFLHHTSSPLRGLHPQATDGDTPVSLSPRRAVTAAPERRNARFALVPSVVATMPLVANPASFDTCNRKAPIERITSAMGVGGSPTPGGRPHNHRLGHMAPLRLMTRKDRQMSNNPRLADMAVNEVMETQEETRKLLRLIDAALADGEVTVEEALAIREQACEVKREADEDVVATEKTNVGELLTVAGLTGTYNKRLLADARNLGLHVVIPQANVVHLDDYRPSASTPA